MKERRRVLTHGGGGLVWNRVDELTWWAPEAVDGDRLYPLVSFVWPYVITEKSELDFDFFSSSFFNSSTPTV